MRLPCRPAPTRCLLPRGQEYHLAAPLSLPHLLPCLRSLCLSPARELATAAAARRAPCRRSRAPSPDRSLPEGSPRRSFSPCRRNRRMRASSDAAARFRPRLRLRLGARFRGRCCGLWPPGRELAPPAIPRRRPLFSPRGPSAGTPSPGSVASPSSRAGRRRSDKPPSILPLPRSHQARAVAQGKRAVSAHHSFLSLPFSLSCRALPPPASARSPRRHAPVVA